MFRVNIRGVSANTPSPLVYLSLLASKDSVFAHMGKLRFMKDAKNEF